MAKVLLEIDDEVWACRDKNGQLVTADRGGLSTPCVATTKTHLAWRIAWFADRRNYKLVKVRLVVRIEAIRAKKSR